MKLLFRFTQVFFFLLPFQMAVPLISGVDLAFSRIFALFLFGVYVSIGLASRKCKIPFSGEAFSLGIFCFLSLISVFWAQNFSWAIRRALFFLSFYPLFPVCTLLFQEVPNAVARLFRPVVIGAGIAAFIGILEFLSQFVFGIEKIFRVWTGTILPIFLGGPFAASVTEYPSLLVNVGGVTLLRVSAFFPDPHMAAFYFGMTFPLACAFIPDAKTVKEKILFGGLAFMLLFADLLTFSRGGYVGLVFGVMVALIGYVVSKGSFRKGYIVLPFFLAALSLSMLGITPIRERLLSAFSTEEGSNIGRIEMYSEAVRDIARQPFGYGLGNYPLAVKPTAEFREPIYAHDIFLDVATESGILGMAMFFIVLVIVAKKLACMHSRFFFAGLVSLSVFFGHALFEMPLYSVHIVPILILLLALPASARTVLPKERAEIKGSVCNRRFV